MHQNHKKVLYAIILFISKLHNFKQHIAVFIFVLCSLQLNKCKFRLILVKPVNMGKHNKLSENSTEKGLKTFRHVKRFMLVCLYMERRLTP